MKILMINVVCGIRSTGRICTDLAVALEAQGHDVKIAYGRESVPEQYKKYAIRIGTEIDVYSHGIKARLFDAVGLGSKIATWRFLKWVSVYNPDVIHLHNLHGYYINVPMLFRYIINNNKKVIWTFHDLWPITGHSGTCDMYSCEKWRTGCGKCPAYRDYPSSVKDNSANNYLWKKALFTRVEDLTIVTPSNWLAGLIQQSFLKDKKIEVIPNGIDTKVFRPLKNDFKPFHSLANKTILLGCTTCWSESKGLYDFYKLAEQLNDRYQIVLVGLDKRQMENLPKNILGIERTNSVKELVQIYSAADIFLNLTHADNYPSDNLEALACGTPVITYKTGGSPECLSEKNGKAFNTGDIESLASFLNEEYEPNMFKVELPSKQDRNYLTQKFKPIASGNNVGEDGYFEIRDKYQMTGLNVVLGVAAAWEKRKGMDVFIKLAEELPHEYKIVMVGVTPELKRTLPNRILALERTDNQNELRCLYSAADVFLNPTTQDNYPTVNLEASSCGTPVITYNTGGSPENSYTPSCVVEQGNYNRLKRIITDKVYEGALRVNDLNLLGKGYMSNSYLKIYCS